MKDTIGYSVIALVRSSRGIDPKQASGRSSRTGARVAARDPVTIGIVDAPLMGPLNASRRDPESNCILKMSGGDVTRHSQGYGFLFPKDSSNKPQASSPKQQASSSKPQAASSKILEPRYM